MTKQEFITAVFGMLTTFAAGTLFCAVVSYIILA